jgi:hypothetical protein
LKKTTAGEYLLRFIFGGAVALAASAVGEAFGPRVGGLFLAFPALLPASLTLIKRHDGRSAAAQDARGALLGSLGLTSFAVVLWATLAWRAPWLSLSLALLAWATVSAGLWWCVFGRAQRRA